MKLLNFRQTNRPGYTLGVKLEEGVLPLRDSIEAILFGDAALPTLSAATANLLDESGLILGPPIPNPGKILCVGLNYRQHAAESGLAVPETPVLFSKFNNAITSII